LRAGGQLIELGEKDMRFTLEEASEFLGHTMGLDLSGEDIAALEEGTEGWITGLQLAAHTLKGHENEARVRDTFSGSTRHVFDYLADEVLSQQPDDVEEFLLKTSIVETLSGSLCEALTGGTNGWEMLHRVESDNLFLVPLDEDGHYYRYHHLFATFLRERLRRAHPEAVAELHRRAGLWYEEDGCISGAVEHVLAAGDFERAADLIEEETCARRRYVDASLLLRWLGTLPNSLLRGRPQLCVLYAWALVHSGALDDVEHRLRDAEVALMVDDEALIDELSDEQRTMLGEICIVRARMAAMQQDTRLTTELSNRALELLPEDELQLRGDIALDLGHAYSAAGDFDSAQDAFARAAASGRAADDLRTTLFALHYQAVLAISRGHLREAEELLLDGQRLAEGQPDGIPSVAGIILTGLGDLHYHRGELDEARRLLERGIEQGRQSGEAKILVYAYVHLARVCMARGDAQRAYSLVLDAGKLTPRWPLIWAWQARLFLIQGNIEAAARWAREYGASEDFLRYPRHLERITIARVLLGEGKTDEALDALAGALEDAESEGRVADAIELLALLALASEQHGNRGEALVHLERALSLAEPEGYVRVFVDEGPPMARLLARLIRQTQDEGSYTDAPNGTQQAFAGRLLEHFALEAALHEDPDGKGSHSRNLPGLEPLSERELEVLELVALGRSNAEIAGELYLSVGTIKAHVHHIFGKLLVRNRSGAVNRARELGLLGQRHPN